MGTYLDIELAVQAENANSVIQLFNENNIEFIKAESCHIEGENLAFFILSDRNYAEIDAENNLLVAHGIQYSAFNYGVFGEVDEQMRHFRINDGVPKHTTIDLDDSKISYDDLERFFNTSKSLDELQSLVDHHRNQQKNLNW